MTDQARDDVQEPEGVHAPRTMAVTPATPLARPRWWPGVAAWALWALTMLGIAVIAWLDHLARQAGRPELAQLTLGAFVGPVLSLVSAATVGAVLASRRPRHPVGWLLLVLGLSLALGGVVPAYAAYGLLARPGALPGASAVARYWPATVLVAHRVLASLLREYDVSWILAAAFRSRDMRPLASASRALVASSSICRRRSFRCVSTRACTSSIWNGLVR